MPRIRTIKPDFWSDRRMVKLSAYARLFYMGMWNFALCDRGHLPDDAEELKLKILPADDVDPDALLAELIEADRVRRYTTPDGETFLWAWKLGQHQKIDGRWQPRCPYCALDISPDSPPPRPDSREAPGRPAGATPTSAASAAQESANPTEPHASSGGTQRDSPGHTETPRDSPNPIQEVREGKGREGSGGTAPLKGSGSARAREAPPDDRQPESPTERLLAEHVANRHRPPPSKQRAKIAEEIHALVTDDPPFTPDEVHTVLDAWAARSLGPGSIGSIADELFCRDNRNVQALDRRRALPASRASPSGGTDANLSGWADLAAELRTGEGGVP